MDKEEVQNGKGMAYAVVREDLEGVAAFDIDEQCVLLFFNCLAEVLYFSR